MADGLVDVILGVLWDGDQPQPRVNDWPYCISKESLKRRRQIDELWKAKRATAPKSLANVVLSPTVAESIRKKLRRTTGQNVEATAEPESPPRGRFRPEG